jgi:hypothetical protein
MKIQGNKVTWTRTILEPSPLVFTLQLIRQGWASLHNSVLDDLSEKGGNWKTKSYTPTYAPEDIEVFDHKVRESEEALKRHVHLAGAYKRGYINKSEIAKCGASPECERSLGILSAWIKTHQLFSSLRFSPLRVEKPVSQVKAIATRLAKKENISEHDLFAHGRRLPGAGWSKQR